MTLSSILRETCDATFSVSKDPYLKPPSCKDDRKNIKKDISDFWNMSHVVGAIDEKHIRIQCTKKTGTLYQNYKGFFSLVLLVIYDARYCFTYFDVGQYGSNIDCGVLNNSAMGRRFQNGQMNLSDPEYLEGCNFDPLPYFLTGDKISPFRTWLMRPIPGKLSSAEQIFNYCLSRARRAIENTFSILVARWRLYRQLRSRRVMFLQRYLRLADNATYTSKGFVDSEDSTGNVTVGKWRKNVDVYGLVNLPNVRGSRHSEDDLSMRDALKAYVNSSLGKVDWQLDHATRT